MDPKGEKPDEIYVERSNSKCLTLTYKGQEFDLLLGIDTSDSKKYKNGWSLKLEVCDFS